MTSRPPTARPAPQTAWTDSLLYAGADILGAYQDSATIPLAQVLMLMITTSDNTAALWAQHLAGGAAGDDP